MYRTSSADAAVANLEQESSAVEEFDHLVSLRLRGLYPCYGHAPR
jgi:hypothetical protein